MNQQPDQPTNTLRAGKRELNKLLDAMDQRSSGGSPKREHVRWEFRELSVALEIRHPGGNAVMLPVATRNLSHGGVAVLHRSFAHPGTQCTVSLKHPTLGEVRHEGVIRRCEHVGGQVHELGIEFENEIDTREYLELDPLSESFCLERVEPEKLQGAILLLDDSELDHKLTEKFLESTFLSLRCTKDPDEAIEIAKKGVDLILSDYHLGEVSGPEVVGLLRAEGVRTPVVMVTGDKSKQARDNMRSAGVDGYISKPLTSERLLRGLAEYLISGGEAGPIFSSLPDSSPSYSLIAGFVNELDGVVGRLEVAFREGDMEGCRGECRRLSSTATPLGFEQLGEVCDQILRQLYDGASVHELTSELQSVLSICRRIRVKQAAA